MKIITWNVNGYRAIAGQNPRTKYGKKYKKNYLFKYLEEENPDIICLQETKSDEEQINDEIRSPEGYESHYHSCRRKKGYSGVVTFSKVKPKEIKREFGVEKFDVEGRVLEARFEDFVHFNVYFPKGYADSERLDFKLEFYDKFFEYVENLRKDVPNIIVSGDYNTAHKPIDLARPEENEGTSGFMPPERQKLDELVDRGWVDAFRKYESEGGHYTWWSQRGRARENNVGWRIDYHFVTEEFSSALTACSQQPDQKGSDRCPVFLELDF